MRLDLLCFALSAIATTLAACLTGPLGLSPGLTAVALTYIMQLAGLFQYVVRLSAEMVNFMTSAERLSEFMTTEPEHDKGEVSVVQQSIKSSEAIRFEDVAFRWRSELPLVLRSVTFTVLSGQKCGVVGRTGAGKSSLAAALFRLAPTSGGTVFLHGVDVRELRLNTLRRSLAVLPQTPTLFAGTVRFNIHPVGGNSLAHDKEIKEMLEEVGLWQVIDNLPAGLDQEISDSGGLLSAGEKQLFCLARALLMAQHGASVLLMDEATSSCDDGTDNFVQDTITRKADALTTIVIAHRLQTVADANIIIVLDAGAVVATGSPEQMFVEEGGRLQLAVAAGGATGASPPSDRVPLLPPVHSPDEFTETDAPATPVWTACESPTPNSQWYDKLLCSGFNAACVPLSGFSNMSPKKASGEHDGETGIRLSV